MSDLMMTSLTRLVEASLAQWRIDSRVDVSDAVIDIAGQSSSLSISRAPEAMPFRWIVVADGRRRTAASVNGVLRIVRQTLAPGYEPMRLRIAPLPMPERTMP